MEELPVILLGDIELTGLIQSILAIVFAGLMAFITTPIVRVIAFKIGAVDVPRDDRRMHTVPIPRLGGLAIFISFVISLFLFYEMTNMILGMVIGCCIIVMVGIIDDVFRINALIKLVFQIIAALIAVSQGVVVNGISFFGSYIHFGVMAIPITVLWIVGLTNAVNLIDGLDGLACGISTISAVSLFVVTLILGDFKVALLVAILAGACLGFLPFNLNPAKIFVGDTGAMFLGFVLSIISIMGVFKVHAVLTFVIPFLILGIPIFDTAFAVIRRLMHGKHPFSPDRGHLHHRLIDMGFGQKQTVRILYAVSAVLAVSSIFIILQKIVYALVIIAISLFVSVITWLMFRSPQLRSESGLMPEEDHTPVRTTAIINPDEVIITSEMDGDEPESVPSETGTAKAKI